MLTPCWICEQCGIIFARKKGSNGKLPRFCNNACYQLWKKENNAYPGCYKKGSLPWNKGMKGLRVSPETEFKKGHVPVCILPVGSETIRTRKHDGQQHAFIKIAEPNVWVQRHRLVWEEHNGPLPEGSVVHHIDRDTLNDVIENLVDMTRAEHLAEHKPEFAEKLRAAQSKAAKKRWDNYRAAKQEELESQYDTYYWQDLDGSDVQQSNFLSLLEAK